MSGSPVPIWTRLSGTALWRAAEHAHTLPAGRHYHNMEHVRRLYFHAGITFAMPWCPDLDKAILTHDVINDGRPLAEQRSVEWLTAEDALTPASERLILTTQSHLPCEDNRLILLDLADFMFPRVSQRNTALLAREAADLRGASEAAFARGTITYLECLAGRIATGMPSVTDPDEDRAFSRICLGIETVIEALQQTLEDARPTGNDERPEQ